MTGTFALWKQRAVGLSYGTATGFRAADGRFDEDAGGHHWISFEEEDDLVFWCPFNQQIATWEGRAFALGEEAIDNASTYAIGGELMIHQSVGRWILAGGRGIFVLDWSRAFDKLRWAPRVAVAPGARSIYHRSMHARRMPQVRVLRGEAA